MKKLLWLCLCMGAGALYAQTIPVDHYTGQPMISVPLVQLNDRSLSHSISARYDASGVKIDAMAGIIGTNWNLSAGGSVSRELRGLPDELNTGTRKGWLNSGKADDIAAYSYPAEGSAFNCTTDNSAYNFIETLHETGGGNNEFMDTEPDIFHFNAGDISGSFMFDNAGSVSSIKLLPHQDVKVQITQTSGKISSITIISAEGVKYIFGQPENTSIHASKGVNEASPFYFRKDYEVLKSAFNYNHLWRLTKIESPANEKILFNYSVNTFALADNVREVEVAVGGNTTGRPPKIKQYTVTEGHSTNYYLSSITTAHQEVVFQMEETNYTYTRQLLRSIEVNEITPHGSTFVKEITFGYKGLNQIETQENPRPRIFLYSIKMRDDCETHPATTFQYHGTDESTHRVYMSAVGSNNQDMWGYYYPSGYTHKIPTLYVYGSLTGIHRVSLFPKPGVAPTATLTGVPRAGGSTSPAGTLFQIKYPTGGSHYITYSSHDFHNPITDSLWTGGGLRVQEIRTHDGMDAKNDIRHTYEYKKSDGTTSGKLLTLPTFHQLSACFRDSTGATTDYTSLSALSAEEQWKKLIIRTEDNLNADFYAMPSIVYERVTEKVSTGHGKTVYEFSVPYAYGDAADSVWSSSYVHLARKETSGVCPSPGLITAGYNQPIFPFQTTSFDRGLPVKISWYQEGQNDPVREIINTYSNKFVNATTITALHYELIPYNSHSNQYFYQYSPYQINTNRKKVLTGTTERVRTREAPFTYQETVSTYAYGGQHGFLTSTSTTGSAGEQYVKKMKYAADFGAPQATNGSTPLQVKMIDQLNTQHRGGTLVEEVQSLTPSGGTETTYSGSLVMFADVNPGGTARVLPKEIYALRTPGITSFSLSSFSGSGVSRTFNSNAAYTKRSILTFSPKGDLLRTESDRREVGSFHPDTLTGMSIASILSLQPSEVIYSNFDQQTAYSFAQTGFVTLDQGALGFVGGHGLGGWKASVASTKYLTKTFTKKPSANYVFSLWYKPTHVDTASHKFNIKIKSTGGTLLTEETLVLNVSAPSRSGWHYGEKTVNLSGIANTDVLVEVRFAGTSNGSKTVNNIADEILFAPEGADIQRTTYHTAFGVLGSIAADGQVTEYELTKAGKPKHVRDHNRDIRQKLLYTPYRSAPEQAPISIITEEYILDNIATTLSASIACLDVETSQWRVSPASNPSSGSYFNGTLKQLYTFTSPGEYIVWLKITHPSYGTYECSTTVIVALAPLNVSICVQEGATNIDLCQYPNTIMETESCAGGTLTSVDMSQTTFQAEATGCPSGTYTYLWEICSSPDFITTPVTNVGSGSSVTLVNWNSGSTYYIRCLVGSSCNRAGMSNMKTVYIYRSDEECEGPFAD